MPAIPNPPEGGPGGGPLASDMQTLFDSLQAFARDHGFAIVRQQGRGQRLIGDPQVKKYTTYTVEWSFELTPGCTNHNHGPSSLPSQRHHRRLTQEQNAMVAYHVRAGTKPDVLHALFQSIYPGHPLQRRDLYNVMNRIRRSDRENTLAIAPAPTSGLTPPLALALDPPQAPGAMQQQQQIQHIASHAQDILTAHDPVASPQYPSSQPQGDNSDTEEESAYDEHNNNFLNIDESVDPMYRLFQLSLQNCPFEHPELNHLIEHLYREARLERVWEHPPGDELIGPFDFGPQQQQHTPPALHNRRQEGEEVEVVGGDIHTRNQSAAAGLGTSYPTGDRGRAGVAVQGYGNVGIGHHHHHQPDRMEDHQQEQQHLHKGHEEQDPSPWHGLPHATPQEIEQLDAAMDDD
ncbi:hypothetical protein F5Y17DRAFT_456683 [Xylariaceae sp. FL0594]|nr:hypothetical protein F5Y17DRAFT_456683 [Xylariaceae sp. FL0594]